MDWHQHLDPEAVYTDDDYGDLGRPEVEARHLHALVTCAECRRRALAFLGAAGLEEVAERGLLKWIDAALERREAEEGEAFVAWLASLPAGERPKRLAADPRLGRPAVARALLAHCRRRWAEAPREALAWSHLARQAAEALPDADAYARDELRGLAWAYQGNVLRILSDLPEAARCFARARRELQPGAVPDLALAEARSLEASLLADQRRFDAALECLDQAAELYRGYERLHLLGRVMLQRAKVLLDRNDSSSALETLAEAAPLLDLTAEPRLRFVLASVRLSALCEVNRFAEARAFLPEAVKTAVQYGSLTDQLRVKWRSGHIATAFGTVSEAEAAFLEVRGGFLEEGIAYDTALVTLDLAALYLEQGRSAEIRRLAAEMLPIFESRQVAGEALAALCLFTQAALTDQLTLELMTRVRRRLDEARSGA